MIAKGWFVAPRTGVYKFMAFGDDGHWWITNNTRPQCPIDNNSNPDWTDNTRLREKGDILCGSQSWTYQTEVGKYELKKGEYEQISFDTYREFRIIFEKL